MCLNPIQIVNPSKYVSLKYRDRFLLSVPCGKCAECQQTMSNQWFLRAWYECLDLMRSDCNSYVYFDTLTYDDDHLPHMSDVIDYLPRVSCFRPEDIRLFIEALRIALKRNYQTNIRYFISSEYGSEKFTTRPHYHLLLFVYGSISPIQLSQLVAHHWSNGRTDGIPWKSSSYVMTKNVIGSSSSPANYLRACRYVTKYVQKSCLFTDTMNKRLQVAMQLVSNRMPENWIDSVNAQRLRMKLKRRIAQFHRQSQHFGESLLSEVDLKDLFEKGCVYMPSPKGVRIPVLLSTYYKRKLFYSLVQVDGCKSWQLNELGVQYREYRKTKLIDDLAQLFLSVVRQNHLDLTDDDCVSLADYVYNIQGRINADKESTNLAEKLPSVTLFNYVTMSDKEHLTNTGLYNVYLGNNSIGYQDNPASRCYSIKSFIANHVMIDEKKEKQLNLIYYHLNRLNTSMQDAYELKQRLSEVYKAVRL